jgi:hypothetical protein
MLNIFIRIGFGDANIFVQHVFMCIGLTEIKENIKIEPVNANNFLLYFIKNIN